MAPSLIAFASQDAMARRLADLIEIAIARGVAGQGLATVALSGGSTPEALYRELSRRDLDWPNVTATLVDERFARRAAGSNEALIRRTLLQGAAGRARFVGLMNDAATPAEAAEAASPSIAGLARPFDVVILGMGADGHTASWFPNADGLDVALADDAPLIVPARAPEPYPDRLTTSLKAIRDARLICLVIAGEEKRATFDKASAAGSIDEMPVRAILKARPDLWVCWAP